MASEQASAPSAGRPLVNIVDKPLPRGKDVVGLSSFSALFSEFVRYTLRRSPDVTISELERRLSEAGYGIGQRMLELLAWRDKQSRREKDPTSALRFISGTLWKSLFGRPASQLQRSNASEAEFYIYDSDPITNRFISVPEAWRDANCAAFIGGIINGALDSADFLCTVEAHDQKTPSKADPNVHEVTTVFIIRFEEEVMQREASG